MNYVIQPWRHQLEAIERAKNLPCFALFFEMGAGKTGTCINILRHKFNVNKRVLRTLILCPPIVVNNWKEEWAKHSKIRPQDVILLKGSGKQRLETFHKHAWDGMGEKVGKVFVTNYEALLMSDLYQSFMLWEPDALVLDESHKCKALTSKRTKLAVKLSEKCRYKYLLSGTPILNSPMDIFSQYLILDNGRTFGKNFFGFRGKFFRDRNAGMPKDRYFPDWKPIPGALEDINRKIYQSGMRVTKEECLDLPPLVRQVITVGMTGEQARVYEEMKKDFMAVIQDKACVATLAMTKALRLQQIASGYIKVVDGEEISLGATPKQEALKELLADLTPNHKVIVWACWRQNYEQIRTVCKELGIRWVEVHGEISAAQKYKNVDEFNNDPAVRVFIGHPGSGGIGINLVVASYAIFYSRNFSLDHSLQAEARNHRGGSEIHTKITRIDLVTGGSIDEIIGTKLDQKIEISDKILRDLASELKMQC